MDFFKQNLITKRLNLKAKINTRWKKVVGCQNYNGMKWKGKGIT